MVIVRPVDEWLPRPEGFRFTRASAIALGCCARCGLDVDPAAMEDTDRREWFISALCPSCWDVVTEDCE